jgi:thiamine-monophosphate kinase
MVTLTDASPPRCNFFRGPFGCEEERVTERDLIEALSLGFPRAPEQVNAIHEADAEILRIGDALWAATVDDFTAEEDLFFDAEPWLIGWNVVAATLSDLLSVGAIPRFFLHAVCTPPELPGEFLREFVRGAREAMDTAGCFLIGGDVGRADHWRYTGTALGPIGSPRPLTRRIPEGHHTLWVSGPLGGANVAAAKGTKPPRIRLHLGLAEAIREFGSACTDTSGGFCDALWNMSQATSGARFEIDLEALPMAREVPEFSIASGMPKGSALLGGAGEYELLFSIPEPCPEGTLLLMKEMGCRVVGSVAQGEEAGVFFRSADRELVTISEPPPCPRASGSAEAHIRDVAAMAGALFGRGTG